MKITTLLALTAFTLTATLRADDAKPINPALLYWQAAAVLPQLTPDQTKELRELAAGRSPFDLCCGEKSPRQQERLCISSTKRRIPQGTCDWGLPKEDGPYMALPHLSKMQEMASLAIVQAETAFAEGKTKDGLDWLILTHHVARMPVRAIFSFPISSSLASRRMPCAPRRVIVARGMRTPGNPMPPCSRLCLRCIPRRLLTVVSMSSLIGWIVDLAVARQTPRKSKYCSRPWVSRANRKTRKP